MKIHVKLKNKFSTLGSLETLIYLIGFKVKEVMAFTLFIHHKHFTIIYCGKIIYDSLKTKIKALFEENLKTASTC
ncbi:hypothetical protein BpHYR1_043713 [Brachionus plicatilis]|uniref:Uncharacterized protein n=1 Tax=Brachionus plicatilis TaxID=10195 RepID=A0A3M7QGC7_BRAPC|nr:hypothetical protein BpHYR1_043713 [Brachionus plicatilis]